MKIYALGLDTDETYMSFVRYAVRHNIELVPINLRAIAERGHWRIALNSSLPSYLGVDGNQYVLPMDGIFFCRLIDLQMAYQKTAMQVRWDSLVSSLRAWMEMYGLRVVNRPLAGLCNGSKPLHQWSLSNSDFQMPDSLTSSTPEKLREFAEGGPTIVKTLSGVRANCTSVTANSLANYRPNQGPLHLQRRVRGKDLRVHCVDELCFVMEALSQEVDYRKDSGTVYRPATCLPSAVEAAIIAYSKSRNIVLGGWDFKVDDEGRHWLLEVNAMPGFGGHDRMLGGEITHALCRYLKGTSPAMTEIVAKKTQAPSC